MRSSLPVQWFFTVAAARWLSVVLLVAACGDTAAVVTVQSDLAAFEELSDFCILVEDRDPSGGAYAESFRLSEQLALPQTLTVFPGAAAAGVARARGFLDGQEVVRDQTALTFSSGISEAALSLDACQPREAEIPDVAHTAAGPGGALAAVSYGRGGSVVVAIGDEAVAFSAGDGQLLPLDEPLPAAPDSVGAVSVLDADGDCDDDLALATPAGLEIWLRQDGRAFSRNVVAGEVPALRAVAAADVDEDGDADLVAGGGDVLMLFRNDGAGGFEADAAAIDVGGGALDVTALALTDVSGDGHPDLIVGQGAENPAPVIAFVNDASGTGFFEAVIGALPPTGYQTRAIAAIDSNADGAVGILLATVGGLRHFVNRGDGRLEDRSFVTLPEVESSGASSVAVGDFDENCIADVVVGRDAGAPVFLRGTVTGELALVPIEASGNDGIIADADDDGTEDVVLTGGETGILWLTR